MVAANMRIQRIDDALECCGRHLSNDDCIDDEIKSLLTRSLLILICAEFEKMFRDLIIRRCSSVSDKSVKGYIESYTKTVLRGLRLDGVSGLLARFGSVHQKEFKRLLEQDDEKPESYSSIVNDRNKVAHGGSSNATFGDVKQYYEEAHVVLDYFSDALFRNVDGSA